MRFMVAAVLAATVFAGGAAAATPDGFWTNTRLAPAASFVAGKQVTVNCATTRPGFVAFANNQGASLADLQGFVPAAGADVMYLSPATCAYLNAWLNGKKVANLYGVAGSMLTLAHEAKHLSGIANETDTDCAALHALPRMVTKFFPLKKRESLHDLMFDAWRGHSTETAAYQQHPC